MSAEPDNGVTTIHSLPNRLLMRIFVKARDDFDNDLSRKKYTPAAVVVSQVCRRWRKLAITYRTLWTMIRVTLPWDLNMVQLCLARSKSKLVAFELVIPGLKWMWYPNFKPELERLIRLVIRNLPRFRRLVIQVDGGLTNTPLFYCLFRELSKPLHKLRNLVIEDCTEYKVYELPPPFFSEGLPGLRSAKISVALYFSSSTYGQVTSFHFRTDLVTFGMFQFVFSQFRTIRVLAIYGRFLEPDEDCLPVEGSLPAPVTLPFLSEFHSYDHTPLELTSLLLMIHATQAPLRQLVIVTTYWIDFRHLERLNLDSYPSLKDLTIAVTLQRNSELDDPFDTHRVSKCFPNVELAAFLGPNVPRALENLCKLDVDGRLPFPKLKTLDIETAYPLRELLRVREHHNSPLSKVNVMPAGASAKTELGLTENSNVEVVVFDFLKKLRRNGMFYPAWKYGCSD